MKQLITGGCSFSECPSPWVDTWPKHLARSLPEYTHESTGMSCQGNGLISRRIIYQVTEALKTHNADNLLVGIMWSGPSRHDLYLQHAPTMIKEDGFVENPTRFIPGGTGSWTIINHGWKMPIAQDYYRNFHDMIGQYIYTNEHILRVQWFLKLHNIRYFMGTYTNEVFRKTDYMDVKHLYDQIDFNHFLPVSGEYEWCRDSSGLEFPINGDRHPSSEQHKLFTDQVILPFLKEKQYI